MSVGLTSGNTDIQRVLYDCERAREDLARNGGENDSEEARFERVAVCAPNLAKTYPVITASICDGTYDHRAAEEFFAWVSKQEPVRSNEDFARQQSEYTVILFKHGARKHGAHYGQKEIGKVRQQAQEQAVAQVRRMDAMAAESKRIGEEKKKRAIEREKSDLIALVRSELAARVIDGKAPEVRVIIQ